MHQSKAVHQSKSRVLFELRGSFKFLPSLSDRDVPVLYIRIFCGWIICVELMMNLDKWPSFITGGILHPFGVGHETVVDDSGQGDGFSGCDDHQVSENPSDGELDEIEDEADLLSIRDMVVAQRNNVRAELVKAQIRYNRDMMEKEKSELFDLRSRMDTTEDVNPQRPILSDVYMADSKDNDAAKIVAFFVSLLHTFGQSKDTKEPSDQELFSLSN